MGAYFATDNSNFIQAANEGIEPSLIPSDAFGKGYAMTRDTDGKLYAVNISDASAAVARAVVVRPEEFVPDGDTYRCDIAVDGMVAQTWLSGQPYGEDSEVFFETYVFWEPITYDGGFAMRTTAIPASPIAFTFRALEIVEVV